LNCVIEVHMYLLSVSHSIPNSGWLLSTYYKVDRLEGLSGVQTSQFP
jgi:hypothetical protein